MLRLMGASLIAGVAVLAAALGTAWLFDARATEGGRVLAASLADRDADTAARPLEDCNAEVLTRPHIVLTQIGEPGAAAPVCNLRVRGNEHLWRVMADAGIVGIDSCQFAIGRNGDRATLHDINGCTFGIWRDDDIVRLRDLLGSCLADQSSDVAVFEARVVHGSDDLSNTLVRPLLTHCPPI
ncbi:MAG: hypothetical protein ACQRW7_08325 [Caulobacterales bacterium]|uniref:hypothetical protein n=1 Tax=Glycocaulis sp. TaxID=1969725 RepID=UPI003FA07A80